MQTDIIILIHILIERITFMAHTSKHTSRFGDRLNSISPSTFSRILFFLFMFMGVMARIWQFGIVPGDIHQDEAFAGYEAYSLLHYGMDSAGYRFPVYLTVWGSGMSALNSYLMIPFMALFGPQIWVIRLPQVIVGCLTLLVTYLTVKRLTNKTAALCALFLLAISPWHIALSRWGLDANLAPGFLMFGFYFFLRGMDKSKYLMLSGLMYGLSLYCYATIWPMVPLIIILEFGYGLLSKKIRFDKYFIISAFILAVFALPLMLFLLVNMGLIEEIRLPFLSIPKLVQMRGSEISLDRIPEKLTRLWHVMKVQSDGIPANGTEQFGIYHMGTLSFFMLGLFYCVKTTLAHWYKKEFSNEFFLLVQVGTGLIQGALIYTNIHRSNMLFIPMIIIAAIGIYYLCSLIDLRYLALLAVFYLVLFAGFERYYFTDFRDLMDYYFCRGLKDAVTEAVSYEGTIYYSRGQEHSRILFLSQEPVTEFIDTVEYFNYPSPYLVAKSFGRFCSEFDAAAPDKNAIYLLSQDVDLSAFEQQGFILHTHGYYTVAFHPENVSTP